MAIQKQEYKVLSSDRVHQLAGVVYLPEGEPVGFFHVVHGMTEYIGRYERFMTEMAENGWICFGYDHLGHGYTVNNDSELGYIAKKDGWSLLVQDVHRFAEAAMAEFSPEDKELPYVLMGHSMGSFIVRLATETCVHPDRLIIMGTGGPNPAAGAGLALIGLTKMLRGDRHISKLLDSIAFGSYNDAWKNSGETAPNPWLTSDQGVRKRYFADPLCTFKFTVSAMGDLITLTKESNRAAWYQNLPKDIPMLLVAGAEDPVGDFGKGVRYVHEHLLAAGIDATCKLYEGARHEILNDFSYEDVVKDILAFCK